MNRDNLCDELCKNHCASSVNNNAEVLFKVLIIGDVNVGKSSLLHRIVEDDFVNASYNATIGVDFKTTKLNLRGKYVKLHVWDTAGHERFRTMTSAFYRGTHGAVLVFDVTKYQTFQNIDHWLKDLNIYACSNHIAKILVGNKSDMSSSRAVSRDVALRFADSHNMSYFETSAKTGDQVHEAFRKLISRMLDYFHEGTPSESSCANNFSSCAYLSGEVGNAIKPPACSC